MSPVPANRRAEKAVLQIRGVTKAYVASDKPKPALYAALDNAPETPDMVRRLWLEERLLPSDDAARRRRLRPRAASR